MNFFFEPRGVAVVGATPNPLKSGSSILKNLRLGYEGAVHLVNPRYTEIEGLRCYPAVADIPDPADLAIILVPAGQVPATVEACAKRGIPGAMIESSGFAESSPAGADLQKEIARIAARTGIQIWGPNCMGLVDAVHNRLFTFMDQETPEKGFTAGAVSLVVQSGMLSAIFLIDMMSNATTGISKVCSVGNKVDVNECDLLEYLMNDPDTRVIGLYLESFVDGQRFLEICRRCKKPIVVLKGGKSRKGAEAALSHTASLAGNRRIVAAALAQAGVIEATDFKQMMDLCRSFALMPSGTGRRDRVAVVTFSGGAGIVSTDFLEIQGLTLADLSESTRKSLQTLYPDWMPASNPIDLWPAIEKHTGTDVNVYSRALDLVFNDPGVDALIIHASARKTRVRLKLADLAPLIRASGKPAVVWMLGLRDVVFDCQQEALQLGIPVFTELSRASECLGAVLRERFHPDPMPPRETIPASLPGDFANILSSGSGPLDEHASKEILRSFGIPTAPERIVSDIESAASALGYPIVMKGLIPGSVHKTEMNLVQLDIRDDAAARKAFTSLTKRMEGRGRVLIQKQIPGKAELILGLLRDPQFGPCVMFGIGGVSAELFDDAVFAVAPLSHREALNLISRIRGQKMLDGFRGEPPVNRDEIARIIVLLGEIGIAFPGIREIDINPLICGAEGPMVADATIIPG